MYMKFITREFIRKNPEKFFIFGDNLHRVGYGGQAKEMRGEPNSIGVRTKATPEHNQFAYFNDAYPEHWRAVREDLRLVEDTLKQGFTVVYPEDGIGTGLAMLPIKAPKIHRYITQEIEVFELIYGKYLLN